jgi:hypothetical protein
MEARALPRRALGLWMRALRLPLTTAELAAGKQNDTAWPPALAFESFEATAEVMVGSVLRDDELVQQGRLTQAKVAELREAARLETIAEQRRFESDAEYQRRKERADEQRRAAAEQAEARKKAVEEREARERAEADRKAQRRKDEVERAETVTKDALADRARDARAEQLDREAEALEREREAANATAEVINLDEAVEEQKESRRARAERT